MSLSTGARPGTYGAGGMGEVYRARDTKLDLSRDGRRLAFVEYTTEGDIWVIALGGSSRALK